MFLDKVEHDQQTKSSFSRGISERGINLILEKFATTLFYNDMSLKRVFECFDIDKDGSISKNEFIYGMNQLQLGLSIFEIT